MTAKLVVGPPIDRGLRTDRLPFVIDNDSFPLLINAYQWRGRVKRKRGTSSLTRLQRYFNSSSASYTSTSTITLDGSGNGNLITGFSLQTNASIVIGSVVITAPGPTIYTDQGDGTFLPSGTINYATGAINIASEAGVSVSATFLYYPDLPVMGIEDFVRGSTQFPTSIGFDTKYSYVIPPSFPYTAYDVSFYKNPPTSGSLPGYVQKTTVTPTSWNGQDYRQFWTTTYQNAMWATNGINVPFNAVTSNIGMQFKPITGIVIDSMGPPAIATLTIVGNGLSVGDFVFINEVNGIDGINWQTGYVINAAVNTVQVEFPNAVLTGAYASGGIAQYLTNRSDTTKDCLRWYDGDPTNGNSTNPTLTGNLGWVNFAPPLSQSSFSIDDLSPSVYYLVGARMIVAFKDRLLFLGPVIQTSTSGSQVYLPDTVIYSQNGTPYYTASFQGDPRFPTSIQPILTPANGATLETGFPSSYFEDSSGFGGFVSAGLDEQILTSSSNEDVLILGFNTQQARLFFTGNDITPFEFYLINSELGSSSTFSSINMDQGVITRGSRGYVITSQTQAQRIDLQILDQVFQVNLLNNGTERFTAQRDYVNEWIYFTYVSNQSAASIYGYPNQTLLYNYRDNTWAIFNECYTTYGKFNKLTGNIWSNIGLVYPTWSSWNVPWSAGASSLENPQVIAGNQQGFVIVREDGTTGEAPSLYIQGFSGSTVTSPNHCLNNGDYIILSGCLGTIDTLVNGLIFSVTGVTQNTFVLNPTIDSGTYLGGGLIKRMYVPFIQTKQFPVAWEDARKTRLGVQRYLLTNTQSAQIQLLIYLSQNNADPYNDGPIVPDLEPENSSLIYSTTLYTCPESTNLGLTPANSNLMTPTASAQQQLWHRINTSLIGDTVQLAFRMSDAQMRSTALENQFAEIELHGFILDVSPSQFLV